MLFLHLSSYFCGCLLRCVFALLLRRLTAFGASQGHEARLAEARTPKDAGLAVHHCVPSACACSQGVLPAPTSALRLVMGTLNSIKPGSPGNLGNNLPLPQSHSLPKPIFFLDLVKILIQSNFTIK